MGFTRCGKILTGRVAFPELSEGAFAVAILKGRRPQRYPMSREGHDFEGMWNLAASCWEANPSDRPSADYISRTVMARPGDALIWPVSRSDGDESGELGEPVTGASAS